MKLSYGDVIPTRSVQAEPGPAAAFLSEAAGLSRAGARHHQRASIALERRPKTFFEERAQQLDEEHEVSAVLSQLERSVAKRSSLRSVLQAIVSLSERLAAAGIRINDRGVMSDAHLEFVALVARRVVSSVFALPSQAGLA